MKKVSCSLCALLLAAMFSVVIPAGAQEVSPTLRLRPRCLVPPGTAVVTAVPCPDFLLFDPETAMTGVLTVGKKIEMEVVVRNPLGLPIQAVQSWLEYDPFTVEVTDIKAGDAFPLIAPGELEADIQKGLIKIGVSNVSGGARDVDLTVARITVEVRREAPGSYLRFHDWSLLGFGHTRINVVEQGEVRSILQTRPRDLLLVFGEAPPPYIPPGALPTPPPVPTEPPPPQPETPGPETGPIAPAPFGTLQPQGLRLTTVGDTVYALWDFLSDARVAGYNLYYSSVSGRYLHRRTLPNIRSSVIRGLPIGARLYFALTAYSTDGEESEFSYEVAVTVGDPASSSSPLLVEGEDLSGEFPGLDQDLSLFAPPPVPDTGALRGDTGFPTAILLLLVTVVATPTFLVFSRRKSHTST